MPKFDQTPVFDRAEDLNNDDFIEANRKKFKTAEDVADPDSDFTDRLDEESVKHDEAEIKEALNTVRQDIREYDVIKKGPDNAGMASYHVDHDNTTVTAVREEGLVNNEKTDPDDIEGAPLEEEFAEANIAADSKVNFHMVENARKEYRDKESGSSDNLKTMPENKIQRNNRGLIRKFLDNVWNKN